MKISIGPKSKFTVKTAQSSIRSASPLRRQILAGSAVSILGVTAMAAQISLSSTSYLQNFDLIGTDGLPAGWTLETGATATSLGTDVAFTKTAVSWGDTGGAFKNFASSDGRTSTDSTATQAAATDRALGIRQTGSFGDPSAAFTLQISDTVGLSNFSLSFSAQMLSVQGRSTVWSVQYGLGSNPTSFTTLATYNDPGTFGGTTVSADAGIAGIANQSQNVWLRIVALSAATGSGSRDSFGIDDFVLTYTLSSLYFGTTGQGVNGASTVFDATTADFNSKNDGTGTAQVFDPNKVGVFGGTSGNVTVGTVTANAGLQFAASGYVFTGGTLTLGTVPNLEIIGVGTLTTIHSKISGTAGLTKLGAGKLVLDGQNDYTGTTTVSGGILNFTSDENLGSGFGPISLAGGTLQASGDVDLGPRMISGTGAIEAPAGKAFNIYGTLNTGILTLPGAGTVALFGGGGDAVTGLIFTDAGKLMGNALTLSGNLTTTNTGGTVTVENALEVGSTARTFTIADGAANVDTSLNSNLTGSARIAKLGAGTLRLAGANAAFTGIFDLGTATTTPSVGGRILIGSKTALGNGTVAGTASIIRFNDGTIEAETPLTGADAIPLGLSLGAGQLNSATFAGMDMEFIGPVSMFRATGVNGYAHRITVKNHTTFLGSFGLSTGTSAAAAVIPELDIDGVAGTSLTLANGSNAIAEGIVVSATAPATIGPDFIVAGSLSADFVTIRSGALKTGAGASFHTLFIGEGVGSSDATLASSSATPASASVSAGLFLGSDAVLNIRVDTNTATADSFTVTGGTTLGDASGFPTFMLSTIGNAPLTMGLEFKILDEQDTLASTGTFRNFNDMARISMGGNLFEIDYNAGSDANDVVLRVIPEPTGLALLGGSAVLLGLRRFRRSRAA